MQMKFENSAGGAVAGLTVELRENRIVVRDHAVSSGDEVTASLGGETATLRAEARGGELCLVWKSASPGFLRNFSTWLAKSVEAPARLREGREIEKWEYLGSMWQGWATLISALGLFLGLLAIFEDVSPGLIPSVFDILSVEFGLGAMVASVLVFAVCWGCSLWCRREVRKLAVGTK